MITLNLDPDQPLVRIESAADIIDIPGFVPRIDPATEGHRLTAVIGAYLLDEDVHCGLPCNQPHRRGYVVRTDKGAVIMLGKDCGKKHFDVAFATLRAQYVRIMAAKTRRETIERARSQLPLLKERVREVREAGAPRIYQLAHQLRSGANVPGAVRSAVDDMVRTGNPILVAHRAPTSAERELYAVQHGRPPLPGYTIQTQLAHIEGLAFFTPELDLRTLLSLGIEQTIAQIEAADLDAISTPARNRLAKAANQIEGQFERIELAMSEGLKLLTRKNLQPLMEILNGAENRRQYRDYLNALPR